MYSQRKRRSRYLSPAQVSVRLTIRRSHKVGGVEPERDSLRKEEGREEEHGEEDEARRDHSGGKKDVSRSVSIIYLF